MSLSSFFGLNNAESALNQMNPSAWGYVPQKAKFGTGAYLSNAINNMNQSAGTLGDQGASLMKQGQGFFDPSSDFYAKQRAGLGEQLQQGLAGQQRNMNQGLAMRGIGGGAIRNMLNSSNANQLGEQIRQGEGTMLQQGMAQGANLLGMGMQGLQGAGSLYGQVGQLGSDIDSRYLQGAMFNTAQGNQAQQLAAQNRKDYSMMNYNQGAAQDANNAALWGGLMGLGTTAIMAKSDIRVKENIEYLNTSPDGHKVYAFNYKGADTNRYKGVMAQDILETNKDAVKSIDGILHVDYSRLDVDMEVL